MANRLFLKPLSLLLAALASTGTAGNLTTDAHLAWREDH
jgi:hypothetical protein